MKTIGITGGIGSGKTVVSHILEILSYPVYNADLQAKHLMQTSFRLKEKLTALLGNDIYTDGQLNRSYMASLIFSDAGLLREVNRLVHPEVKKDFREWCARQNRPLLFLESAILYESGFDDTVDRIWVVTAPEAIRLSRVSERDRIPEERVKERMRAQSSEEEKTGRADRVIINDGVSPLLRQIQHAVDEESEE